jgi:hypothetical protein
MIAKLDTVRSLLTLLFVLPCAAACLGQSTPKFAPPQSHELLDRALASELRAARDTSHPMRYRLRKCSPRLTSTKEILETRDGAVARLVSINDKPLSQVDEQKEAARLDALLADPGRQRHRKQNEDQDTERALKVLRALPSAFLYQLVGTVAGPSGKVEKFAFRPNPNFSPPDLETQVLTAMTGEIWIDTAQERVTRLEGHLERDVDFGWGILGRLNKGGWIVIEQADVSKRQWRIVRFQMVMTGRVLFKTKSFDTVEEQTQYMPLSTGLSYQQAIQMLRAPAEGAARAER